MVKIETVKGFRDFTGEEAQKREEIRKILVETFGEYGFEPAETPVVEYREFVKGDNSNDEAVSDVFKLKDRGERDLALRYEFTFQLKRLMEGKKLPFKRFQIGYVFRDEPTTGNRLRQFTQCDVDIVGATIKDEAEILAIVKRVLTKLGIKFIININNRKLLNEILEKQNIEKMDWETVIREVDKMDKLDEDEIYNNLRGYNAQSLLEIFKQPEEFFEKYENYKEIKELKETCKMYGVEVKFMPSLARGLSYYNGSVFEVKSEIKETITAGGSFMFNSVQSTGISFGLERLSILTKINVSRKKAIIISLGEDKKAIEVSEELRNNEIICNLFYGKISKALEYANAKNIDFAVFIGSEEAKKGVLKIKDLKSGDEELLKLKELINRLK
jgi:histidyl-tRNA synthetase